MAFEKVAKLSELAENQCHKVDFQGEEVLLIRKGKEVFAIHDLCTHSDASLCDGMIEGDEIECPLHFARFNIKTGEVTSPPAFEDIKTYKVRVSEDDIELESK